MTVRPVHPAEAGTNAFIDPIAFNLFTLKPFKPFKRFKPSLIP